MAEHAVLYVNGRRRVLPADRARQTLLSYLREDCGLTGSKLGCGEGGCGACTVTLCHWDAEKAAPVYKSVNACLAPLYSVVGMHIVTVEGIGSTRSGLHPVQQKLACAHGSQCGFCTPGFVMSMYTQLRAREPGVTLQEHEIESNLAGNLCRCTGYRPILEGFRAFAATPSSSVDADAQVDPLTGVKELPLLPEELRAPPQPLNLSGATTWHRPVTLEAMLELKRDLPEAKVICGNTEVGIEVMIKGLKFPQIIAGTHVPELRAVVQTDAGVMLGSSITLSELEAVCKQQIAARPDHETQSFHAVLRQLHWFAGRQIRNVSSLAGNIVTGSPISDLNPLWSALNATFICQSAARGRRSVSATEFWTGYRKNLLAPDELLVAVVVPATRRFEYVKEFKQSHRRDDDIAIVNAGMRVAFEQDGADSFVVKDLSCAYGGMAATTKLATGVADAAPGLPWQDSTLQALLKSLHDDMALPPDVPGGMPEYREALSASFFFKFFVYAATSLERDAGGAYTSDLIPTDRLAANAGEREPSRGCQYYGKGKDGEQVGLPLVHASAHLQVSGEAQYNDDLSDSADTLHAALVMSEKPHARISVNFSPAEAADGVVGCYSAKDVPGDNHIGAVVHDEEIFATDTVTCVGQIIGIVVADTKEHADAAARLVKVDYDELPAVLSIEDAIEAESYFEYEGVTGHVLRCGDVEAGFSQCDHVVEGQVRCGGQEHFYLEPSACVVVPLENNEIHTVVSTQCVDKSQRLIASALGIACSKVVARSKRIGGGFGGKETRAAFINVAAAVAAYCCQKPVRLVLDRHVDMAITGQRHAFVGKYKVGCTAEGRILSLKIDLYNNAGNSLDLSQAIMDRALFHADGSYAIANMEIVGHVCRTNLPSNTAFRGFGGPQTVLLAEMWLEKLADAAGMLPEQMRELNLVTEGHVTHYGMALTNCQARACWSSVSGDLSARRAEVDTFNEANRWRKRGIALTPVKFGISFTATFMNQAGCLIHIYRDGTVLISHGGIEMGQGLHTKVCQVAATVLGIPTDAVFVAETSTDKVPNASPSAASASSDLYGMAVLLAAKELDARLQPVRAKLGADATFAAVVESAYFQQIDLCAHGFYKTPDIFMDWNAAKDGVPQLPFNYFCYGAALSEVEIDCLTGDMMVRRTDICMDVGESLNPAIDVGQVEGGFVQGMGWVALEELKWGDKDHRWIRPGHLFTRGPGAYKIPSVNDIPPDFRVSLLKNSSNPRAVYSSKAVGEPPLLLANSVFLAIKDAVRAARVAAGQTPYVYMDSPATPERIRMACVDFATETTAGGTPKLSV